MSPLVMHFCATFVLFSISAVVCAAGSRNIRYMVPGGRWTDADGNFISAHAGTVVHNPQDGLFYWFGQDIVGQNTVFQGVCFGC
jgi:hypothetical protein